MRQSNIYTVKRYEVEHLPGFCTKSGKEEYSSAIGFGMSTSIKKALKQAREMYNQTSNGGTPILGGFAIFKGGKLFKGSWEAIDQSTFESFKKRLDEEQELEELIAEEEAGLAA